MECQSLDEVRHQIDAIDRKIVALLAERGSYVRQAAKFKQTADEVRAPQRVEQVIAKVRGLAVDAQVDADIVEQTYRTMIAAFIAYEMKEHSRIIPGGNSGEAGRA